MTTTLRTSFPRNAELVNKASTSAASKNAANTRQRHRVVRSPSLKTRLVQAGAVLFSLRGALTAPAGRRDSVAQLAKEIVSLQGEIATAAPSAVPGIEAQELGLAVAENAALAGTTVVVTPTVAPAPKPAAVSTKAQAAAAPTKQPSVAPAPPPPRAPRPSAMTPWRPRRPFRVRRKPNGMRLCRGNSRR